MSCRDLPLSHHQVPISEGCGFVGKTLHFNQKLPNELEYESGLQNKTSR